MYAPEGARGHADVPIEYQAHVTLMLEPCAFGNGGQRQVGVEQERLGGFQADTHDLPVDGSAQGFAKTALQYATRHGNISDHVNGTDAFAGMIANEPHGLGNRCLSYCDLVC